MRHEARKPFLIVYSRSHESPRATSGIGVIAFGLKHAFLIHCSLVKLLRQRHAQQECWLVYIVMLVAATGQHESRGGQQVYLSIPIPPGSSIIDNGKLMWYPSHLLVNARRIWPWAIYRLSH